MCASVDEVTEKTKVHWTVILTRINSIGSPALSLLAIFISVYNMLLVSSMLLKFHFLSLQSSFFPSVTAEYCNSKIENANFAFDCSGNTVHKGYFSFPLQSSKALIYFAAWLWVACLIFFFKFNRNANDALQWYLCI